MTDELTPEQEADISRLLAEARHDEPIPADVAARLDAVLGDLSADDLEVFENRTAGSTTSPACDAAAQRGARLLIAAAAVVVGGVAVGQVLGSTNIGSDSDDAATSADAGGEAGQPANRDDAGGDAAVGPDEESGGERPFAGVGGGQRPGLPLPVRRAAAVHEQGTSRSRSTPSSADVDGPAAAAATASTPSGSTARSPARAANYGEGAKLPAYYDEQEAVLVLRRPSAGIQRVDLLACGTASVLASADLPARAACTGIFLAYDRFNRLVNERATTHV